MSGESQLSNGVEPPDERDAIRFQQLKWTLEQMPDPVFLDYRDAERVSGALAEALVESVGRDVLERSAWLPIPRGGYFVLGMLSYALDLGQETLRRSATDVDTVVVVDDCLISGRRFRQRLAAIRSERVLFAHLCSHPSARRALEGLDTPSVVCIAGQDLKDHSGRLFDTPEERADWESSWRQRLGGESFWVGMPDLLGFAWSEPDRLYWNPVDATIESGWRLFAPRLCLRNRKPRGLAPKGVDRQWRISSSIVIGDFDDRLLLYDRVNDTGFALAGVAREMWRRLVAWGNETAVVEDLLQHYQVDGDRLRRDLEALIEELSARRLLRRISGNDVSGG